MLINNLENIASENNNMGLLASYLLSYDKDMNELTIQNICNELYISVASATRLAKRLGYNGFKELKLDLILENKDVLKAEQKYLDITTKKYYQDIANSLSDTLHYVDMNEIKEVSNKLRHATKLNCFAIGGSNITLMDFSYKIQRINKPTTCFADSHMQYVEAKNSDKNTMTIALSYSGITTEVLNNLKLAHEYNSTTVLITGNENIDLEYVDYLIIVKSDQNSKRTYSIASRLSTISILDLIYLSIIESDPKFYNKILHNNRYIK